MKRLDCLSLINCVLATFANRNTENGTFMVSAFKRVLDNLTEDLDSIEFLRRVQHQTLQIGTTVATQTPQIVVFPHKKLTFRNK
jgi:hypothetical protein